MKKRLLLVDDESQFVVTLQAFLQAKGFDVDVAETADRCLASLRGMHYDLLVLDLTLPDEDGLCLLRKIRSQRDIPVIIISGRSSDEDRIAGLELGADDYMVKPFSPTELALRINRRIELEHHSESHDRNVAGRLIYFGGFTLDLDGWVVLNKDKHEVELTPREFDILATLAKQMGRVLSREQLIDGSLESNAPESSRAIDVIISRLRAKLEENPDAPMLIKTVKGRGYRLINPH